MGLCHGGGEYVFGRREKDLCRASVVVRSAGPIEGKRATPELIPLALGRGENPGTAEGREAHNSRGSRAILGRRCMSS